METLNLSTLKLNGKTYAVEGEGPATPTAAVLYTEQILSETQKTQARENIGAASAADIAKEFVLIETITLTEATALIERTQEPSGSPYNFKDVFIEITGGDTNTAGWLIWEVFYGGQSLRIFRDLTIFDVNNILLSSRSHGNLRELWFGNSTTNYDHAAQPWNVHNRFLLSWENITKMTFQHQTAMPVGTKIIIYAVRGQ